MEKSEQIVRRSPYETANLISKIFFWWNFPIFFEGLRKELKITDLYKCPAGDDSEHLGDKLQKAWDIESKNKKPRLIWALIRVFGPRLLLFNLFGAWQECFLRMVQPIFLGMVVKFFTDQNSIDHTQAYLAGAGVCLFSFLLVISYHPYVMGSMHIGMRMRVACCSMVYRKSLRLSSSAIGRTGVGHIINLMSNDVNKFDELTILIGYLFLGPAQTAVTIWILWSYLGPACLTGMVVLILFMPFQGLTGKYFGKFRRMTAGLTDRRIRHMNEIISGMRVIKMYTWEKPFAHLVNEARAKEVRSIRRTAFLKAINLTMYFAASRVVLFSCFITFVLTDGHLTAETVFLTMALFNALQFTMTYLFPYAIGAVSEALVSTGRIQKFLSLEEKDAPVLQLKDGEKYVQVDHLAARWEADSEPVLKNISFYLKPGQLLAVIGPVGAGKSTLLMSLLGELPHTQGKVEVKGKIAYASQEPWSFNGSVRDNILFGRDYDEDKFKEVVRVAALERDLKLFAFGDKTLVGEKGVSLSGGQKARVSLARALYNEADVYFLDDPLSAVDAAVANHIFDECVMDHLHEKIRVLVTHQVQFIRKADLILVLNDGKAIALGTYDELINSGLDFVSLLGKDRDQKKVALSGGKGDDFQKSVEVITNKASRSVSRASSVSETPETEDSGEFQPKVAEETKSTGTLKGAVYWNYIRAGAGIFMLIVVAVISLASQVLFHSCDLFLSAWTNEERRVVEENMAYVNQSNAARNSTYFDRFTGYTTEEPLMPPAPVDEQYYVIMYSCLILALFVFTLLRTTVFFTMCMRASVNLHNTIFIKVLRAPMALFDNNPSGIILNRFARDLGIIDELLPANSFDLNLTVCNAIGVVVIIGIVNYWLIIPAFFLSIIAVKARSIYMTTAREVKRFEGMMRSPVYSHVTTTMNGLPTIRAFGSEKVFERQYYRYVNDHSGTWFLHLSSSRALGLVMDIICVLYVTIITIVIMAFPDNIPGGNAGLILSSSLMLVGMFQRAVRQSAEFESQMTSVERILEYKDLESEGDFEIADKRPPSDWPQNGEIRYSHVSFTYGGSTKPVLTDLTFKIDGGEKVGVVGRTGAGKSSLLASLFRMVEPEGNIYIDGIDTKQMGLHDLRKKISIIPQEPVLFMGPVRRNLDPFSEHSDEDMWRVLEEVQLKETVLELSGQLDAQLTEGGSNFSVGQRQLICLARAILRNNKILVLDEATANVDHKTDSLIQQTIRKRFQGCTVITIAHRLNTIIDSDRVLVLDAGQVTEFNEPYVMLQQPASLFRKLVKQTGHMMSRQLKTLAEEAYNRKHANDPDLVKTNFNREDVNDESGAI